MEFNFKLNKYINVNNIFILIIYISILFTLTSCDKNKTESETFVRKGNLQFAKSEYVLASHYYDEAIKSNPENPFAYNNRGLTKLNLQIYTLAISDFSEAILINNKYWAAYLNRA